MKKRHSAYLLFSTFLLSAPLFASGLYNQHHTLVTKQVQASYTPAQVLTRLKTGNARFLADKGHLTNHLNKALYTAKKGQHPLAIILNCVDSRSIANYVFDESVGSIFVARVAGNVADPNILGSMEFAAIHAGAKVIVVMGHTHCGAISAACHGQTTGTPALDQLLKQIQPAVKIVRQQEGRTFSCNDANTINRIAKQNVLDQIQYILIHSPDIARLVHDKKIIIIGAMHDIKTGKVRFFDEK